MSKHFSQLLKGGFCLAKEKETIAKANKLIQRNAATILWNFNFSYTKCLYTLKMLSWNEHKMHFLTWSLVYAFILFCRNLCQNNVVIISKIQKLVSEFYCAENRWVFCFKRFHFSVAKQNCYAKFQFILLLVKYLSNYSSPVQDFFCYHFASCLMLWF